MKRKILVVALGGTIGSTVNGCISLDGNNLRILQYYDRDGVQFEGVSPFAVLSENMCVDLWRQLFAFLSSVDYDRYDGVIILHGSDTLAYTAAMVGNAFSDRRIVLVAADKPLECPDSNGVANFALAVEHILGGKTGVFASYNRMMDSLCITSAGMDDDFLSVDGTLPPLGSRTISDRRILVIQPYVNMDFDCYNTDNIDAVLIGMYHSATVPQNAVSFSRRMRARRIPCYFVTHRQSADYETAQDIDNIIFSCTMENAYARLLLTK